MLPAYLTIQVPKYYSGFYPKLIDNQLNSDGIKWLRREEKGIILNGQVNLHDQGYKQKYVSLLIHHQYSFLLKKK